MNYQFTSRQLTLDNLSRSNQGHMTFKRLHLLNGASYQILHEAHIPCLIEARRASAGILPETVLISGENNYCDRNTTYPLYIASFHCYMTFEASLYKMQHI